MDTGTMSGAEPVLAYDGDCGFCQAAIDRIGRLAGPRMSALPWQALPEQLTTPHLARLDREVLIFQDGMVRAGGAEALARYTGSSPARRYRLVAAAVSFPGVRFCARRVYSLVARNRHRLRIGPAICSVAHS
ncbi:thiol-disulfide oxidoreductase DCC family protein [Kitasatospora azatica]|uniref:thiol-disulfide oxidoreductase DCC family protein n=1 Tax=Kitasatospora azatica TaxID=58347 RepID=UPI00055BBC8C|nr:DCC1-like thiol-disulfide oxidoreductase family protein [Kitasatospora azatica]